MTLSFTLPVVEVCFDAQNDLIELPIITDAGPAEPSVWIGRRRDVQAEHACVGASQAVPDMHARIEAGSREGSHGAPGEHIDPDWRPAPSTSATAAPTMIFFISQHPK